MHVFFLIESCDSCSSDKPCLYLCVIKYLTNLGRLQTLEKKYWELLNITIENNFSVGTRGSLGC